MHQFLSKKNNDVERSERSNIFHNLEFNSRPGNNVAGMFCRNYFGYSVYVSNVFLNKGEVALLVTFLAHNNYTKKPL